MTIELIIKISLAIAGIIMAGFFAGTETGLYRISAIRLKLDKRKNLKNYRLLTELLNDRQALVFTTLSGTNLSHYIVTSIVTGLFISILRWQHQAEMYTTLVLSPILFIFSEVLPKNMFFTNPYYLMPKCAKLLWLSNKIFTYTAVIPVLKFLTKSVEAVTGIYGTAENLINTAQKHQVLEIVRQTKEEGILGHIQASIIDHFISITGKPCQSIARPLYEFDKVSVSISKLDLQKRLKKTANDIVLVYDDSKKNIIGYIDVVSALNKEDDFQSLTGLVCELKKIACDILISDAIESLTQTKIALVINKSLKPVAVIQLSDILEEMADNIHTDRD